MAAKPVMTAEELFERVGHAPPPTDDDVTILWDGRRLDSREKVLEWLAEVEAKRAEEAGTSPDAAADGPLHDVARIVEALERHGVEYLLIGGVAAVGYGAQRPTEDTDCVVRRSEPTSRDLPRRSSSPTLVSEWQA
jgi:hypothetical protein